MLERIIVITAPQEIEKETEIWMGLLGAGLSKLHIRKAGWSKERMRKEIEKVPLEERKKLVIHYYNDIREELQLGGLHLSYHPSKVFQKNSGYSLSVSVHQWAEMEAIVPHVDYAFISPVFDSISKKGYEKNESLQSVPLHLRSKKIYALGGVNDENIQEVFTKGYYGAALLGYIWKDPAKAVDQLKKLRAA